MEKKGQKKPISTSEDSVNKQTTTMNTIDPKAQVLINQFNDLTKKLSDTARQGAPSQEEEKVMEQMRAVSKELRQYDANRIDASINVNGYDYDVSIAINGKNTGITGNKNTSLRLFNVDSVMALIATQDAKDHNFILNMGKNAITITYKKNKDSSPGLEINLLAYDNDKIMTVKTRAKDEGTVEKTFILEPTKPAYFQTITVSE